MDKRILDDLGHDLSEERNNPADLGGEVGVHAGLCFFLGGGAIGGEGGDVPQ